MCASVWARKLRSKPVGIAGGVFTSIVSWWLCRHVGIVRLEVCRTPWEGEGHASLLPESPCPIFSSWNASRSSYDSISFCDRGRTCPYSPFFGERMVASNLNLSSHFWFPALEGGCTRLRGEFAESVGAAAAHTDAENQRGAGGGGSAFSYPPPAHSIRGNYACARLVFKDVRAPLQFNSEPQRSAAEALLWSTALGRFPEDARSLFGAIFQHMVERDTAFTPGSFLYEFQHIDTSSGAKTARPAVELQGGQYTVTPGGAVVSEEDHSRVYKVKDREHGGMSVSGGGDNVQTLSTGVQILRKISSRWDSTEAWTSEFIRRNGGGGRLFAETSPIAHAAENNTLSLWKWRATTMRSLLGKESSGWYTRKTPPLPKRVRDDSLLHSRWTTLSVQQKRIHLAFDPRIGGVLPRAGNGRYMSVGSVELHECACGEK